MTPEIQKITRGQVWGRGDYDVRVLAHADNWVMVRRKGCVPFCVHQTDFRKQFYFISNRATS